MNKTLKSLSLTLLILLSGLLYGQSVSSDKAKQVALSHYINNIPAGQLRLKSAEIRDIDLTDYKLVNNNLDTLYYVFNVIDEDGFIIIAADQRVHPIIGVSYNGKYEKNNQPPAFVEWMEYRSKEIQYAKEYNLNSGNEISALWEQQELNSYSAEINSVSPLLKTTWNQSCFYNDKCPYDINAPNGYCSRVPAGCVAIAMAQVMKYWNHP
jgi:hypothetical protein